MLESVWIVYVPAMSPVVSKDLGKAFLRETLSWAATLVGCLLSLARDGVARCQGLQDRLELLHAMGLAGFSGNIDSRGVWNNALLVICCC